MTQVRADRRIFCLKSDQPGNSQNFLEIQDKMQRVQEKTESEYDVL